MSGSAYGNKTATIVRCIYDLNRVQPTEVSPQPEAVPKIAYGPFQQDFRKAELLSKLMLCCLHIQMRHSS